MSRLDPAFVVLPPWTADGAAGEPDADEESCGLVKEECAGGAASWSDVSARALSFNVVTEDDVQKIQTKIGKYSKANAVPQNVVCNYR